LVRPSHVRRRSLRAHLVSVDRRRQRRARDRPADLPRRLRAHAHHERGYDRVRALAPPRYPARQGRRLLATVRHSARRRSREAARRTRRDIRRPDAQAWTLPRVDPVPLARQSPHVRVDVQRGGAVKPLLAAVVAGVATCWVLWPSTALSHGSVTTTVLFDREIVRVLNSHCVMCHTEGGSSFPISTYEQTWLQRLPIRTAVLRRHMPPWAAVAGYGQFANDNSLTLREEQFVISWVEGLGPRNAGGVFLNVSDPKAR